jgi:hypothetical protein
MKEKTDPSARETTTTRIVREELPVDTTSEMDPLEKILSALGTTPGVMIRVSKKKAGGTVHCFRTESSDIDLDWIRDNYGGGVYVFRIFLHGDFRQTTEVEIAEPLKTPDHPTRNPEPKASPSGDSPILERLIDILERRPAAPAPAPTPWGEMADVIKTLAELNRPAETQTPPVSEMFAIFEHGLKLGERVGKGAEPTDWKTDAVRTVRDALPEVAAILRGAQAHNVPQATGAPEQVNESNPALPVSDDMIRQGLARLRGFALMGVSPEFVVDMALVNIGDPRVAQLVQVILDEKTDIDRILSLDAQISGSEKLTGWCRQVVHGLRSEISPSDPVDDDPAGSGIDGSDDGSHEDTGAGGKPIH